MSGSKIRLYGSTSGYVELEAPAVAPDAVLTLPPTLAGIGTNVVQTVKTDTFSTTSTSYTTVTGLTLSFTPTSATSKVLVMVSVPFVVRNTDAGARGANISVFADGVNLVTPDSPSNRIASFDRQTNDDVNITASMPMTSFSIVHAPATTSAITYDVRVINTAANGTVYINRTISDTDTSTYSRGVATLIAVEVAA